MFLDDNLLTINKLKGRGVSEAYINEYQNSNFLNELVASPDYRRYMTKSLIERGFLYKNSKVIEYLRRAPLEELFNDKYKNIFLYSKDRDLEGVYPSVEELVNMEVVGNYDLMSSMLGCITAKLLPIIETRKLSEEEADAVLETIKVTDKPFVFNIPEGWTEEHPLGEPFVIEEDPAYIEQFKAYTARVRRHRIEKLVDIINHDFYSLILNSLDVSKAIMAQPDLYRIFKFFRTKDKHYADALHSFYMDIVRVFSIMCFTVSMSETIKSHPNPLLVCYPLKIVEYFVKHHLGKLSKVEDTIGLGKYFVPKILMTIFSPKVYGCYERELTMLNPVVDLIETADNTHPIEDVCFAFALNMYNFRTIFERTNFDDVKINADNYMNVFGLFLYDVNAFFQMFYMESYLSKHKFQVHSNVRNLVKAFVPEFDNIVKWEEILSYMRLDRKKICVNGEPRQRFGAYECNADTNQPYNVFFIREIDMNAEVDEDENSRFDPETEWYDEDPDESREFIPVDEPFENEDGDGIDPGNSNQIEE